MDGKLILCFLFLAIANRGIQCCTQYEVEKCMSGIEALVTKAGSSTKTEGYLYALTDEQVKEFCRIYTNEAMQCFENLKRSCEDDAVDALIDGVDDANKFLCDGLEDFLQYKECLGEPKTLAQMISCDNGLKDKAKYITDRSTICQMVDEDLECQQNIAKKYCGDEAGEWLKKYEKLLLKPLMNEAGCGLNPMVIIILATIGGIVLMLITVICIGVCVRKHRNSGQGLSISNRREEPFASDIRAQGEDSISYPDKGSHYNIQTDQKPGSFYPPPYSQA